MIPPFLVAICHKTSKHVGLGAHIHIIGKMVDFPWIFWSFLSWLRFLDWGSAHQHTNILMPVVTNISHDLTIWRAYLDWHICSFRGLVYISIYYIWIYRYIIYILYIYMRPVSELRDSPNKKKDQFVCTLHTFRHFDMALFAERKACRFTIQGWRLPKSRVPNQFPRTPTRTCFKNSHGFFPQFCWAVQRVQTLQVVNGHGSQMLNLWVPWL